MTSRDPKPSSWCQGDYDPPEAAVSLALAQPAAFPFARAAVNARRPDSPCGFPADLEGVAPMS